MKNSKLPLFFLVKGIFIMSKNRIFADGMETVSFAEGMIRIELYNVQNDSGTLRHDVTTELVMTPQGFVKAFPAMENLMNNFVKAGMIKRNDPKENPSSGGSSSPNFA